jgi:uncharacterized membrane protein
MTIKSKFRFNIERELKLLVNIITVYSLIILIYILLSIHPLIGILFTLSQIENMRMIWFGFYRYKVHTYNRYVKHKELTNRIHEIN